MVKAFTILRGLMAFLTSIPVKMDESFLDISSRYMFLFPIIGAIIGIIVGAYARFANNILFLLFGTLQNLVSFGSYNFIFDFLAKGLGAAMTIAFLFVVIGLQHTDGLVDVGNALGIKNASLKDKVDIAHEWTVTRTGALLAILVSFLTFLFIFFIKTDISIILSITLLGLGGLLAIISSIAVGGFMIYVGSQVFEGVNGDIFGATNEIARMVALFVLVII
ncbi:MAG: adenosylcobinamide-GDP ribazoletransferase [Candidatus Bathyarchaeota archaeon]